MLKFDNFSLCIKDKKLLKNISLGVKKGEIIGLFGQSGAGKTTILKSILGIFDFNNYSYFGQLKYNDVDLFDIDTKERLSYCGLKIAYIPQNPMTAFDSRLKIGKQMTETLCIRLKISKNEADKKIDEELMKVNLTDIKRIKKSYPDELSGGMLQRIAFALVMSLKPEILLADEPTSALDKQNSNILLEMILKRKKEMGVIFISHDIDSMAKICDFIYLVNNGSVSKKMSLDDFITNPEDKWAKHLVESYKSEDKLEWIWEK